MYLPHNLDFRGYAYPISTISGMTSVGDCSCWRWLKIHLANLYEYDKGNFDERANSVMGHLEDV